MMASCKGRNDHREAGLEEGGHLKAERFAAAGGQKHEDVVAGEGLANDLALEGAKGGEAEIAFQQPQP